MRTTLRPPRAAGDAPAAPPRAGAPAAPGPGYAAAAPPSSRPPPPRPRRGEPDDDDGNPYARRAAPRRPLRLLLWAAGLVVLGMFGTVVWFAYVDGLPYLGGEPPLVRAEAGPYKHVPDDRGGLAVANQSASVIDVFRPATEAAEPESLPPPEAEAAPADPTAPEARLGAAPDAPDPATLPPLEAQDIEELTRPPPPPAAEAPPAPPQAEIEAAALPPPEPAPAAVPPEPAPPPPPEPAPAAEAAPPPPPQPPPLVGVRVPVPKPVQAAAPPPRQAPPPPARAAPARPAPPRAEPGPRVAAAEPPAPPAPPAPARPPPAAAASYRLQLLALRSEGAMNQAWSQLRERYPAVLNGLAPSVERIATVSGTMYRLQAGPFASRETATAACSAIQGQGGQCFVVSAAQ